MIKEAVITLKLKYLIYFIHLLNKMHLLREDTMISWKFVIQIKRLLYLCIHIYFC